ncbi:MAG: hypothetical protein AAF458_16900 [Pseudomonadota bacterium]
MRRRALLYRSAALLAAATAGARADLGTRKLPRIEVGGASLDVVLEPDVFELEDSALGAWVHRSASVLTDYYGRFPVPYATIHLRATGGRGVRTGNMQGWAGPRINIVLGESSSVANLRADWVLVHEMVHTAFPDVPDHQNWVEEGLAVYVESVARLQAGDLSPSHVWGGFVARMPRGLPGPGDRGLDRTNTWGNRFWGGAIFCLVADLEIRRQTDNQHGLDHALRAILASGLDNSVRAPLLDALGIADQATGTEVLTQLYLQRRHRPVMTDLDGIWRQLGVSRDGRGVHFDETAPEAHFRRSISGQS